MTLDNPFDPHVCDWMVNETPFNCLNFVSNEYRHDNRQNNKQSDGC